MEGNLFASAALFGWIPVVVVLFLLLPRTRAVVWSFVLGWAFLPTASLSLPGIPDFSKVTATSLGIALAAILFDFARVSRFRPRWCDFPMAIFCVCPLASSLSNGLGAYDGLSAVIESVVGWGLPYLIGRLYFTDARALRELAIGMVGGALLYVPLCWFEIRLS
ncbi:MAG: O-antigen ligase domain-containing protein, partial [Planctomycetota bacterium]